MSPEYAWAGLFSEKSDIYSFGVLMLEIISGKRISRFIYGDESKGLLAYVSETIYCFNNLILIKCIHFSISVSKHFLFFRHGILGARPGDQIFWTEILLIHAKHSKLQDVFRLVCSVFNTKPSTDQTRCKYYP